MYRSANPITAILVAIVTLIAVTGLAATAATGQELLDELPDGHDTVIAVDFTELRDSPLYDQAYDALSSQPSMAPVLTQLEEDLGLDLRRDIDGLVVTSDSPPLSTDLLNQPTGALQNAAAGGSTGGLVIVRGDIDPEAMILQLSGDSESASDDEDGADSIRHLRLDGLELRILDDETMAITLGSESFLDSSRQRLAGERSGPGSHFTRAINRLGSSQGIYMMIAPSIEDPEEIEREVGAVASFAAVSVDLRAQQVRIGALLQLDDEENAADTLGELDTLREEAVGNPLTSLLGIQPILKNLSLQQDGDELLIRTSMTNRQASRLARQLATLTARGQQLQQPLEGRGLNVDVSDEEDANEDEATPEELPVPSEDGVEADFN